MQNFLKRKGAWIVLVITALITIIFIGILNLPKKPDDGGEIKLGVMKGSDAFESVRMAVRKLGKEVKLSNQAKVVFPGPVDMSLDFYLDDKGNFYEPYNHGIILDIYDKNKSYQLQRNLDNSYTAYVNKNVTKTTKNEEQVLYYNDYINMKEYYNTDIVDQLGCSHYNSCYVPYWNCATENDQATDGFTCYLYQDGKYIPLDKIPLGEYSYYKYQGISEEGVVSVTPENQGFIFYSLK